MTGPRSPWAPLRIPALLSLGVLIYGVAGYMLFQEWTFLDALYMTVLTMTTVGYREVEPLDSSGKVFTITLLVAGAGWLILTLTIIAGLLQEDVIRERLRRRRMRKRLEGMSGHFIVCGYGRVGRTAAETLREAKLPFVVVDKSEERERELIDDEVAYLIGDATLEEDLVAAGIHRARGLICAVDDDAENVFITVVARSVREDVWIVARASEEASRDRLKRAGASRVYSPFVTAGREMANAAANPVVVDFMEVTAEGTAVLLVEEIEVQAGTSLDGNSLAVTKGSSTALAVRRSDGSLLVPPPEDLTLVAGDVVVLMGTRESLPTLGRV